VPSDRASLLGKRDITSCAGPISPSGGNRAHFVAGRSVGYPTAKANRNHHHQQ
jgi:hypothetical protein